MVSHAANPPAFSQETCRRALSEYARHVEERGYKFTTDWFSHNIPSWRHLLNRFMDVANVEVLEIGSWEGRSTCWLLDNILTHDSAKITCLDTFQGGVEHTAQYEQNYIKSVEDRFNFNIARTGQSQKVRKIVGFSHEQMRSLPFSNYDLIYIDGSHLACDVLQDAVLAWPLLKSGGMAIFDDYDWPYGLGYDHPKRGIDAFLSVFGNQLRVVYQAYQMVVEKMAKRLF